MLLLDKRIVVRAAGLMKELAQAWAEILDLVYVRC